MHILPETIKKLFLDIDQTSHNYAQIKLAMYHSLTESELSFLIDLAHSPYTLTPVKQNDYVLIRLTNPNADFNSYFERYGCTYDIMKDMGLIKYDSDYTYLYGIVIKDDGYQSEFNPYYPQMLVDVYIYNTDVKNTLKTERETCKTLNLIPLDMSELPDSISNDLFKETI